MKLSAFIVTAEALCRRTACDVCMSYDDGEASRVSVSVRV